MKAHTGVILIGLTLTIASPAQTFEVASVKPDKDGNSGMEGSTRESITHNPGSLTMRNVTLKSCIRWAYELADYQISGPAWIGSQRYDVQARAGRAATVEQLRLMLRDLLASRFQLALHRENRELPVYELIAGKDGPRLQPVAGEGPGEMRPADGDLVYQRYSMAEFAQGLPGIPFRVDRPVVDKTGLAGIYNFRLKIAPDATVMKSSFEHSENPLAFDVLRQIGLKLQARKDPTEMMVIDRAERNPAEK